MMRVLLNKVATLQIQTNVLLRIPQARKCTFGSATERQGHGQLCCSACPAGLGLSLRSKFRSKNFLMIRGDAQAAFQKKARQCQTWKIPGWRIISRTKAAFSRMIALLLLLVIGSSPALGRAATGNQEAKGSMLEQDRSHKVLDLRLHPFVSSIFGSSAS